MKAQELKAQGKTHKQIQQEPGISYGSVTNLLNPDYKTKQSVTDTPNGWNETDESATWSGITSSPIKTLADACKAAGVDESIWYVDRWECSQWTVGMMPKQAEKPVQTQQYRVKVYLKRLAKRFIQQAQDAIDKRRQKWAPLYPKAFKQKSKGEYLAVVGLFDVHFGKLAWQPETGNNYDLKIAETLFTHAVDDMIEHSRSWNISNFLIALGNDYFHIDNSRNTTYAGTPQDTDGRYAKIFETGFVAIARAIERMVRVAPVDVLYLPGNHDPTTSYHLCREVKTHFRNLDSVNVDISPSPRKYYKYHKNILGFTHGNEEKINSLPNLMASEKPEWWGETKCRDWFIGHLHKRKSWVTQPMDSFEGSTIRVVKSLSGTDAWHHRKGYIDDQQAAEIFFYHRENGYTGHAVARARK